ncbi:sulfotransferase [Pseudomonas viridiflava]|uniref:sulfotransferase n=1 Tax=Pseudomonas viridiflava TaxID=33069 RepID=UPI000F01B55E|nr:sulfotransferase [Pseudomonas viridiflava]QXG35051.1 sulfotransferase [Pseudomonas viridiflava]QXG43269.1 sulfotransferase [Pseudomonas viridiflava]
MIDMIFVCGCPRSGNTLMGELIGTLGNVTYCGELGVSYFSTQVSKEAFRRTPSSYAEAYRANLMINALDFLNEIRSSNCAKPIICDSTPWNARILTELQTLNPNALFIYMFRHYSGVIQSLRRSWDSGYEWAGPNDEDRAQLWHNLNSRILKCRHPFSIGVNYDELCKKPEETLNHLNNSLNSYGLLGHFDKSVLSKSHASDSVRPTLANFNHRSELVIAPIQSDCAKILNDSIAPSLTSTLDNTYKSLLKKFNIYDRELA